MACTARSHTRLPPPPVARARYSVLPWALVRARRPPDAQSPAALLWGDRPPAPFAAESPGASRCRWDPAHWWYDVADNPVRSYLAPATPPAAAHTPRASPTDPDASPLHTSPPPFPQT